MFRVFLIIAVFLAGQVIATNPGPSRDPDTWSISSGETLTGGGIGSQGGNSGRRPGDNSGLRPGDNSGLRPGGNSGSRPGTQTMNDYPQWNNGPYNEPAHPERPTDLPSLTAARRRMQRDCTNIRIHIKQPPRQMYYLRSLEILKAKCKRNGRFMPAQETELDLNTCFGWNNGFFPLTQYR
ncbi:hypothetical protein BDV25DRAFT_143537 [Aspergillus avenaceus]|uniref:Uncharacterized protein n=1 Tax=Aspergillus avenaceus TaxID=36643 RepID=A0A5N6TK15_ASPAV|nr:hypothetical protein BDV25DRAFT_143537 [Aspergillus avenaceus]